MRAAPMDLRSLSQSYMTLVKFEAERTNRIVTRVGRYKVSVNDGVLANINL